MVKLSWMILFLTELSATITQGPSNTVAEFGEQVKLGCVATTQIAYWFLSKNGVVADEVVIVGPGCSVFNTALANHYSVESIGGGTTCNLIVSNITMTQAGVYRCLEGTTQSLSILTVTDSSPTITYNNAPNVMEGEIVVITCSLNYNGSVEPAPTLRPHFYWTDNTGNNVSNVYHAPPTNNSVVSQLSVTAGRQDIIPYTCHVYLQLMPPVTNLYAANTPPVNSSASSSTIPVLYPVETISISSTVPSEDNCVSKLETLTCTANANPPAQYVWTDLKNNINTTGAVISISSGGEFQCIASNIIRNQAYSEKKNVTEISCHSPYNLTINGTECANNFCTCNGNDSYSEPITITCIANGFPIPSVKWRNASGEYSGPDFVVTHNGNYTCIATNTYGGNPYSAELTVVVYGCLAPPTKFTTILSTTAQHAPISSTTSTTANTSTNRDTTADVAIAMGVLFGISLVANVILLIIIIRRQDFSKRKENIPEPQIPYHSDSSPPAAYEELRLNDGINLQPTTYEQLTHRPPLYENHVS